MRLGFVIALSLALAQGCASYEEAPENQRQSGSESQSQEADSAQMPRWAKNPDALSEGEFVGMGEAEFEARARKAAREDALSQFAQHLGADVVSGSRMSTRSKYSETTAENASIERASFTGVDAQGFVQDAHTQVHVEKRGYEHYIAYARLSVPVDAMEEASRAIEREHEALLERQAEALEILRKQQIKRASGENPEVVFGKAQGEASADIRRSSGRHEARHEALEKARHRAEIELGRQIHGQNQSVSSGSSGDSRYQTSSSSSSGHFASEVLAERVWQLDGKINATVTLFGWSNRDGEGEI